MNNKIADPAIKTRPITDAISNYDDNNRINFDEPDETINLLFRRNIILGKCSVFPDKPICDGLIFFRCSNVPHNYISTDEVEMYCYRSRERYLMVTQLRNYSTTTEATITTFTFSYIAISLSANPEK